MATNTGGNNPNNNNNNTSNQGLNPQTLAAITKAFRENNYELREGLKIQKEINENYLKYNDYMKEGIKRSKEIISYKKIQDKIEADIEELRVKGRAASQADRDLIAKIIKEKRAEKKITEETIANLKLQNKILAKNVQQVSAFKRITGQIGGDIKSLWEGSKKVKGFIDQWAPFAAQKAVKKTALQMGILSRDADGFSKGLKDIALQTTAVGVSIEEIAEMQSSYSDELGRTVVLSEKAGVNMGYLAKVTGLGADGIGRAVGEMDTFGYSAENAGKFIEQSMMDATSMGLNSTKVVKNITGNLKLLNKYRFKDGAKGLANMANSTTKMGVNMEMAAGFADKLFDIEGAVEMSSQLQVMGGEWSKLADPFKLMYMARNDMDGLTDSVINATKATSKFNAKTGEFDISSLNMQVLKKVAESTGMQFEDLVQSAKKAAKFAKIKEQISYNIDPKTEQFIENTAELDKNGRAQIMVEFGKEPKYLSQLTESDKEVLKQRALSKEDAAKRAKQSVSFDEMFTNLFEQFKVTLLPALEMLTKVLKPVFDKLSDAIKDKDFQKTLTNFVDGVGEKLKMVIDFFTEKPKLGAAIAGGMFLAFEGVKWLLYGQMLGTGFLSVTKGGMTGSLLGNKNANGGSGIGGSMGRTFGKVGKFGAGAGGGAISGALQSIDSFSEGRTGEGIGKIAGGVLGGALGTLLDPFMGPFGTMLGAQLGTMAGGAIGGMFDDEKPINTQKQNDAVIEFNPKDKFMKVNDSTMIAGTNENGNAKLANTLNGGIIGSLLGGPIGGLLGSVAGSMRTQPVSSSVSAPGSLNISFDELKLNGVIELKIDNQLSKSLGENLIKDPQFIRNLSLMINKSISQNNNMVQNPSGTKK